MSTIFVFGALTPLIVVAAAFIAATLLAGWLLARSGAGDDF